MSRPLEDTAALCARFELADFVLELTGTDALVADGYSLQSAALAAAAEYAAAEYAQVVECAAAVLAVHGWHVPFLAFAVVNGDTHPQKEKQNGGG